MSDEKHPIRNAILAAVAAGLILSAFLYFVPKVVGLLSGAARFLLSWISIPTWLFLLLAVISAATVIRKLSRLLSKEEDTPGEPDVDMYTQDNFFGLTWRWTPEFLPSSLRSYCPVCDTLLVYHEPYRAAVTFFCETCQEIKLESDANYDETIARVTRQIDRKSRTGEWEGIVRRQLAKEANAPRPH